MGGSWLPAQLRVSGGLHRSEQVPPIELYMEPRGWMVKERDQIHLRLNKTEYYFKYWLLIYVELEKEQEEFQEVDRNISQDAKGILVLGKILDVCNTGSSSNVTSK